MEYMLGPKKKLAAWSSMSCMTTLVSWSNKKANVVCIADYITSINQSSFNASF